MKTVEEWLNELPDGYRERALKNVDVYKLNDLRDCMDEAIAEHCNWSRTPEGYQFWYEVYNHFEAGNTLPLLPCEKTSKPTNPKDALGVNKVPLSGMPAPVLLECGLVKLHGDLKYGAYNWRDAGVRSSVYYDACMRHLMAWWEGEDLDPESQIHHLSHAITGLCVLRDSQIQNNCVDDRPKPTKPGWISEYNEMAKALINKHNKLANE